MGEQDGCEPRAGCDRFGEGAVIKLYYWFRTLNVCTAYWACETVTLLNPMSNGGSNCEAFPDPLTDAVLFYLRFQNIPSYIPSAQSFRVRALRLRFISWI